MPLPVFVRGRKVAFGQTAIANETNTDASATWGAGESTLANSVKAKTNLALAALRTAGILSTTGSGRVWSFAGRKASVFQTNVANEATADSDATYGQPEADLLNSLKAKVNGIMTALTSAGIMGGGRRAAFMRGRVFITSVQPAQITLTADATYTSGGSGEQQMLNDLKARLNSCLAAMRAAGIIAP